MVHTCSASKNGKSYKDVRISLDKAARKARIEAVEVLARRTDTYMDTTGRKEERAKNRHAEVVELVDTQHSGCEFGKRSKERQT